AAVSLGDINGVANAIQLAQRAVPDGTTVRIDRIVPAPHVPHQSRLSIGLDVTSPASIILLQSNSHIPPSHVRRLGLHSIVGGRIVIDPRKPQLLHLLSRKIHFAHGKLQAQPVTWAVEGVQADPGISVTTSQPRFDPYHHRNWVVRLAPVAGTIRITTVPRTPNVEFDLNGTAITTGPNGMAAAPLTNLNDVKRSLHLASSTAGDKEVSALRVSKLPSIVTRERRLVAALDVRRNVQLRFVDTHGTPIPASTITEIQLSAGSGAQTQLIGSEIAAPALLLERVANRVGTEWGARDITYSLASVKISGANAVFAGRQRFVPLTESVWTIRLSVFSLTLTVRDALLGSRIETRTDITRPDGTRSATTVGSSTPKVIPGMVRGLYILTIDSAVVGGTTSVLVSRDGPVELRVITLLDTLIIAVAGALLLPAAVWIGIVVNRRRQAVRPGSES
ncbi:MAG: hypothetical protein ACRDVG_06955, partial [Jatrophihabitantaceae bacterium]